MTISNTVSEVFVEVTIVGFIGGQEEGYVCICFDFLLYNIVFFIEFVYLKLFLILVYA